MAPVWIHRNLHDALKQLSSEQDELCLWIDALCIGQENLQEKSEQVAMMCGLGDLMSEMFRSGGQGVVSEADGCLAASDSNQESGDSSESSFLGPHAALHIHPCQPQSFGKRACFSRPHSHLSQKNKFPFWYMEQVVLQDFDRIFYHLSAHTLIFV